MKIEKKLEIAMSNAIKANLAVKRAKSLIKKRQEELKICLDKLSKIADLCP